MRRKGVTARVYCALRLDYKPILEIFSPLNLQNLLFIDKENKVRPTSTYVSN